MRTQFGSPILIDGTAKSRVLQPINSNSYSEQLLRDLILKHPAALPLSEIDRTYCDPVPICSELRTSSGPIDAFLINKFGLPIVVECKLWRNPEARRQVIGQILDYAKELHRWSYSDLQRQVAQRCEGMTLFSLVQKVHPEIDEAEFIDDVSRNLRLGRFLLLLVGDGIREDAIAIAEYLKGGVSQQFTFGMIEMPIFQGDNNALIITPRVIAKTQIIERIVVEADPDGNISAKARSDDFAESDEEIDPATQALVVYQIKFWNEYAKRLKFDDPDQKLPNTGKHNRVFIMLPGNTWITVYRFRARNEIGLFFSGNADGQSGEIVRGVAAREAEWRKSLPNIKIEEREVSEGRKRIVLKESRKYVGELEEGSKERDEIISWLVERSNVFVNVFRPEVLRQIEEMED